MLQVLERVAQDDDGEEDATDDQHSEDDLAPFFGRSGEESQRSEHGRDSSALAGETRVRGERVCEHVVPHGRSGKRFELMRVPG
jgi:hypothetical protein